MAPGEMTPEQIAVAQAKAELAKTQAETLKLNRENALLGASWWRQPSFLAVIAPSVAAVGAVFSVVYLVTSGIWSTSLERTKAEAALATFQAARAADDVTKLKIQERTLKSQIADDKRTLRESKNRARCLLSKEFFTSVRRAAFEFAIMPQIYNVGVLGSLAPRQLGWSQPRLDELKKASEDWANADWKVLNRSRVIWHSPDSQLYMLEQFLNDQASYTTALLEEKDPSSNPIQLLNEAMGGAPKRPAPITGSLLFEEAKSAFAGATEMTGAVDKAISTLSSDERNSFDKDDLAFDVNPKDQKTIREQLQEGIEAKVPDAMLDTFADEVLRHYKAHLAVSKVVNEIEREVLLSCQSYPFAAPPAP